MNAWGETRSHKEMVCCLRQRTKSGDSATEGQRGDPPIGDRGEMESSVLEVKEGEVFRNEFP